MTPWTVARQAPLSMEFSRQEYWSGNALPSPGDLPDPGIEPGSPVLQADSLPSKPPVSSKLEMGVNLKRRLQVTSPGGGGKALFKIRRELQFGICNCGKSLQGTGRRMLFSGEKKLGRL